MCLEHPNLPLVLIRHDIPQWPCQNYGPAFITIRASQYFTRGTHSFHTAVLQHDGTSTIIAILVGINMPASPTLINHRKILIPLPHNLSIHDKHRNKPRRPLTAIILTDSVMTARHLNETITHLVHPGWVPVHAAQYASLGDTSHYGGPRVPVGRREAARRVGDLEADDGLAGGVWEGVIIEDLDGFAWPGAKAC